MSKQEFIAKMQALGNDLWDAMAERAKENDIDAPEARSEASLLEEAADQIALYAEQLEA